MDSEDEFGGENLFGGEIEEEPKDVGRAQAAVYVSWITFKNEIIDGLAEGLPNVIDKTLFPGQAGGVQNQIMTALKFLGLIDDNGKPTKSLHELTAPEESARKQAMGAILRSRYSAIFALDIERATMGQLDEAMSSSYSVSGDTRGKAIRFFLAAAKYAEIPLSRHLTNGTPPLAKKKSNGARRAQQTGQSTLVSAPAAPAPEPQAPTTATAVPSTTGTSRTVALASGGSLTVSASLDLFMLSHGDREFVFKLIDQLAEYERNRTAKTGVI
jgi:hypothetical protein